MRRFAVALLAALAVAGPPAVAQEDREHKSETAFAGLGGVDLPPLVMHLANLESRHRELDRRIVDLSAEEDGLLGLLLAIASGEIEGPDFSAAYAQLLKTSRDLDLAHESRRELEQEYFPALGRYLPPGSTDPGEPAALSEGKRDEIAAALRKRLQAAWALREDAVDGFLEATIRAEAGWPGIATLARGAQSAAATGPGTTLEAEIKALEARRNEKVDAVSAAEEAVARYQDEIRRLREATIKPLNYEEAIASRERRIAEQKKILDGEPMSGGGLRGELARIEEQISAKDRELAKVRRDSAEFTAESAGLAGLGGETLSYYSPRFLELWGARRRLARATLDTERLCEAMLIVAAQRTMKATEQRRLALRDPEDIERVIYDDEAPAGAAMRAASREARDAAIDTGVATLVRRAIGTEDSLLAQNEYFHALATLRSRKDLRATGWVTRSVQWSGNFLRGVMDLGFGAWDGFLDNAKQLWNRVDAGRFNTKTENTRITMGTERRKARAKVAVLEQARTLEDAALFALFELPRRAAADMTPAPSPLGVDGPALAMLRTDRAFFEATNGGLRRIGAAYDVTLLERLETEYLIACEHASLTLAALERAWRAGHGLNEETGLPTPKIMISPGRIASALSFKYLGLATELNDHTDTRREQYLTMEGLLPLWKKLRFDATRLTEPEAIEGLKGFRRTHLELLTSNPDYRKFWVVASSISDADQGDLASAIRRKAVEEGDHYAARQADNCLAVRDSVPLGPHLMPLAHVEDARDRAYLGDFAGAYASLLQAHNLDWEVVPTSVLRRVENDLAWEETRTLLESCAIQIADQAFYAALTGRLFPPAGAAQVGFLEGIKRAFTTSQGRWGLASFALQQVNPFASVLNWNTLIGGEGRIAIFNLSRQTSEALGREALREGVLMRYMEPELADFLASLVVDFASWKVSQTYGKHKLAKIAEELTEVRRQIAAREKSLHEVAVLSSAEFEARDGRKKLLAIMDVAQLQREVVRLEGSLRFWRGTNVITDEKTATAIQKKIAGAQKTIAVLRNPVTVRGVEAVVRAMENRLYSTDPETARMARADLLKIIDPEQVAHLKSALEKHLGADFVVRLDEVRRQVTADAGDLFLKLMNDPQGLLKDEKFRRENPKLVKQIESMGPGKMINLMEKVVALAYTGSGGKPEGREYKRLKSDLDLTLLVDNMDQVSRDFLKEMMDAAFQRVTSTSAEDPGFPPARIELNFMVDNVQLLAPEGFKASGPGDYPVQLRAAYEQHLKEQGLMHSAEAFEDFHRAVLRGVEADYETLRGNIRDPEKYVITGRLRALSYLTGISGVLFVADPETGKFVARKDAKGNLRAHADRLHERTFLKARLEKWMSFDIMLDDMGFLRKTLAKYGGDAGNMKWDDLHSFTDKMDKYGIRVLLGYLAGNDDGLRMLNDLLKTGGDHGDICDVAARLNEISPGKFTPEELAVIAEWKARKLNEPLECVLARRLKEAGVPGDPDSPEFKQKLQEALVAHVRDTDALVQKLLRGGVGQGVDEIGGLTRKITELANDPARRTEAAIYEKKRDAILLAYAAAYSKLSAEEKAFVKGAFDKAGLSLEKFAAEAEAAVAAAKAEGEGGGVAYNFTWWMQYAIERDQRLEEERRRGRPEEGVK